jgi:hypothetical protein
MKELERDGYLDRRAGEECCDSDNDRAGRITDLVHDATHVELKWPYSADDLLGPENRELLFSLIELFHDVVARPRTRWFHEFEWKYCGFEDFSDRTGQAIYRWKVNDLLQTCGFQLELATKAQMPECSSTGRRTPDRT